MSELASPKPRELFDQLRDATRIRHYSYSTEKTHVHWAERYILFHNKRHPAEMGAPEIKAFLSHLAQEGNVSASIQNQAFNALLFLYRHVLHVESAAPIGTLRAKRAEHLPTVPSKSEVSQVLNGTPGLYHLDEMLVGQRLYSC